MCGCHSRSGRDGKEKNLPLAGLGPGLCRTFIWEIIGSNVGRRIGYPQWVRGGEGGASGVTALGSKVNILNEKYCVQQIVDSLWRSKANKRTYKYVNLLCYIQRSGGYAVYNTLNIHVFVYALVGHNSYNESPVHGRESFKILDCLVKESELGKRHVDFNSQFPLGAANMINCPRRQQTSLRFWVSRLCFPQAQGWANFPEI